MKLGYSIIILLIVAVGVFFLLRKGEPVETGRCPLGRCGGRGRAAGRQQYRAAGGGGDLGPRVCGVDRGKAG